MLLYNGFHQRALDIINPESRTFSRLGIAAEYAQDYFPIRLVSVSPDTRYIAVAGKLGFAHLSTSSGRWRTLESLEGISSGLSDLEQIPHVRGGMCWYGGVLLVGADFGDSHDVYPSSSF
jgi:RAB6A-GEF complex partner protein 1